MSLRFLLDTNVVSAPMQKEPNATVVRRLEKEGLTCAIASPVWHELTYGAKRLPDGRRRAALEAFLSDVVRASFPILPYDEDAASWHGTERARLDDLGTPVPFVDGQIASIAATNGLILVTSNAKDFVRFKDLDVQDWANVRGKR